MKPKQQQILFYSLFFLLIIIYFLPELSLVTKSIIYNGGGIFTEKIRKREDKSYNTEFIFQNSNEIDRDRSYIVLSGSKYIFEDDESSYSYFLDKTEAFATYEFTDKQVVIDNDSRTVSVVDNNVIESGFTVLSEVYIYTNDGELRYDWEIYSSSNSISEYWIARTSYLQQLIVWYFAIFGFFRIKKAWTVVYDSKTKKPISGAIVRIFSQGRLVRTAITSVVGILEVRLPKGIYTIDVSKQGYKFPSALSPLSNDDSYNHLYYGGEIRVSKDNGRVKVNIPLDPEGEVVSKSNSSVVFSGVLSLFDNANIYILSVMTIGQIIIWPTYFDSWAFAAVTATIVGLKSLIKKSSKFYYGRVIDGSGRALSGITLNLYEAQWEKFVRSITTDSKGRYESIEVPGSYYLKVANPEWKLKGNDSGKFTVVGKQIGSALFINDEITLESVVRSTTL